MVVCVKVVDDIKGVYATLVEQKKGGKKQEISEAAVTKHCSKKLSTKDNKLVRVGLVLAHSRWNEGRVVNEVHVCCFVLQCYNLEPLKKDVARQVTYGKDSFKICKLLEKKNPDFCSMRYRTSFAFGFYIPALCHHTII